MFGDYNLWVLLGAALLNFIIGAIWYSPKLFGPIWMEGSGLKESDVSNCGIGAYIGAFITSLILALGMAAFLDMTDSQNLTDALIVAFLAWMGFFLTCNLSALIWSKVPLPVFFVNIGYGLVSYLAIAAFLMFF